MKKSIFISFKYSESLKFKNKLTGLLGSREYRFYGQKFENPIITIENEEIVFNTLSDKIFQTHVTIVLITQGVLDSTWIPKEIAYSLKEIKKGKATRRSGVIGVIIPKKGNDYSYIMNKNKYGEFSIKKSLLPDIIKNNINNELTGKSKTDFDYNSFISIYRWDDFSKRAEEIIDIAYLKATEYRKDYLIRN
ncbi:MAG: TIR domain-containing protein [Candidatus Izemoplasma sp.]